MEDYMFTQKLGSGSYATVYKAYKKSALREEVAVKCIKRKSLTKTSTENLLTEIEVLKTLHHENIVHLRDFQWDKNCIYLIMDYCSGGDLSNFIRSRQRLPEPTARHFLKQLASALMYMRSKQISHFDLKPSNILLTEPNSGILKVADFGFAQYLHGDINADHLRGSPLYMAPEIITKRNYSEKADLWSTGVILYECIFGQAPFHCRTIAELENKILDPNPIVLPQNVEVSPECRDIIGRLLERNPEERISFEDVACHCFLNQKSSLGSLKKAAELIQEAVEFDEKGEYKKALVRYKHALAIFRPVMQNEEDPRQKEALQKKIKEYSSREETLKEALKSQLGEVESKSSPPANLSSSAPFPLLREESMSLEDLDVGDLWKDNPDIMVSLKLLESGDKKEEMMDLEGCLQDYESALETMLPVLKVEPKGRRRKALYKKVKALMSRAEELKNQLTNDKSTHGHPALESQDELDQSYFSMANCVMQ